MCRSCRSCSSGGGRCFGLLTAVSIAYLLGLWQGSTFCKKIGIGVPERFEQTDGTNGKDLTDRGPAENTTPKYKVKDAEDPKDAEEHSKAFEKRKSSARKSQGAADGCDQFEDVSFPLEGWPSAVRAEGGQSLYGTGWAQRLLREHQFPDNCEGKSFVEHGMFRSGMGSNMHIGAAVLAFALNEGMIYLWPEDDIHNPWTLGSTKNSTAECPGQPSRNYECLAWRSCYLMPVSSCKPNGEGPRFTGVKRERGRHKIKSTELLPKVFKALLKCSGYPSNYWVKWWRAQASAFLLRPNKETALELQRFREERLVGNMQAGVLGCYVRHGDKYYEATEYPLKDYLQIFSWILDNKVITSCPHSAEFLEPFKGQLPKLQSTHRIYLGSDDPDVLEEAKSSLDMIYVNVSRLSKRMPLMKVSEKLGAKQVVMESLLNLQLLMESDAFICTWTSNWCRLVDEMRMTVAMKATYLSLEVNKHCPRFNWVHGKGAETPDFR